MLRIMNNFKDELYGPNMCYKPDGSIGPKVDPKAIKTDQSMVSNRKTSMSSMGRKAMD